jgi:hypothetical protein
MIENPPNDWESVDAPFLKQQWENGDMRLTYNHSDDELTIEKRYGVLWEEINVLSSDEIGKYPHTFLIGLMHQAENEETVTDIQALFKQLDREFYTDNGQYAGKINDDCAKV